MRKNADFWIALVVMLFCCAAACFTARLPSGGTGTKYGPNFFPWLTTGGLAVMAVLLMIRSLKNGPSVQGTPLTKSVMVKLFVFFLLMFLYAGFYITGGYLLGTGIFFVAAMLILGERRILHVLVIPAALTFGIYLVFTEIMQVYLP